MKNIILIIALCLFYSCKKDIKNYSEQELQTEIITLLEDKTNKANFKEDVVPLIDVLYKRDTLKYSIVKHISNKAKEENNVAVLNFNAVDIKNELEKIKK